jgi:hypothetical protein
MIFEEEMSRGFGLLRIRVGNDSSFVLIRVENEFWLLLLCHEWIVNCKINAMMMITFSTLHLDYDARI